jgi:hypothetical protein
MYNVVNKFTVIVQINIEERNIPIIYNVYGQIDSPKKSYSSMPQLDYDHPCKIVRDWFY